MKDFLIKEALNNFDQNQIKYCVFKSTDHLLAGLKGETDIDLLIEEEAEALVKSRFGSPGDQATAQDVPTAGFEGGHSAPARVGRDDLRATPATHHHLQKNRSQVSQEQRTHPAISRGATASIEKHA